MKQTISNTKLFWAKGNESVIIPTKREEDGGYDIYANFEEDYVVILPHKTEIISTNLYCAFPSDYIMILKERGSTGTKGIAQRSGVIDSGFRNSIGVPLTNTNDVPLVICKDIDKAPDEFKHYNPRLYIKYPYSKAICQAILVPLAQIGGQEISLEDLKSIPSERGIGMLGSSGK